MKKLTLKVSCFVMAYLLVLSSSVFAADVNASVSKTTVEQGQSFTISVNSGAKLTDFEVAASTGSLSLPSVTSKYSGSTTSTSGTKSIVKLFQIAAQADKNVIAAGTNLATFKYEVPKTQAVGNITITITFKGVDSNGEKITASATKTVNVVKAKSTNNYLSDLKVDGTTVANFNKNTTSYNLGTVETAKTSINITATAEDSLATVSGIGTKTLKEGKNTFTVKVTAENGSTKSYILVVTRTPAPKSTNNYLSSLKVDGAQVKDFNKNTTSYNLGEVESSKTSIKIAATAEYTKAKVSGAGTKSLKEGKNTFTVKVTAENGSVKSYTITVTRKVSPKSTNNYLSSLKVDGVQVKNFNKNTTSYNLGEVENTKTSVKITVTAADGKAKVSGTGTKTLKEGKNTFTVKVTAENGSARTYTLIITRKAKKVEPVKSANANLMGITINGVSIENFAANTNTYSYKVTADVQTIDVVTTTEDTKATVKVDKPNTLNEGTNIVKVTVTAENGSVKEYIVNVEKEKAQDVPVVSDKPTVQKPVDENPTVEEPTKEMGLTTMWPIIIVIVLVVLILLVIVKAIQSRKK